MNGLQYLGVILVIVIALYWPRHPIRLRPLNQIFTAPPRDDR